MRIKTGGSNVTKLLNVFRNTALGLSLLMGTVEVLAAGDALGDGLVKEEMVKFSEENEKLRDEHIQEMRSLHIKHVNEMYDRRLTNNKEMSALWRQLKPGDSVANKALRSQIKKMQNTFHDDEKKFRKEFKENILKPKNKEFRNAMGGRVKGMKKKHKD